MSRKNFLIFTILFVIFAFQLHSQNTWEHVYNPYPYVYTYAREDVVKHPDGGYVFCGGGILEEEENPGYYYLDFGLTMKVDANGILEWVCQDSAYSVFPFYFIGLAVTSDGGIVTAAGSFQRTLTKRNAQGNLLWQIDPGLTIESLIDSEDGGIIAVGYAPGNENNMKKFSSNGDLLWGKRIDAYNLFSVEKTYDGGFITSGCYNEQNYGDVAVAKTNANGDTLWIKYLDGANTTDEGKCVFETSSHEIIVVGRFDYGPGFIWKLDQFGETLDLEIVDLDIGWQIFSANEYIDNSIITLSNSPEYIVRYNRFDSNLNFTDTMIDLGSVGDKGFIIDDEYLVYCKWPDLTITKTLYQPVGIIDDVVIANDNNLLSNYPNPFNPSTIINFSIQENSKIELSIINTKGQMIKTITNDEYSHGVHSVIWNGDDNFGNFVSSGVYYYKLNVNGKTEAVKKCLLLK